MSKEVSKEVTRSLKVHRKNYLKRFIRKLRYGNRPKVFCIGANKTGTTSLAHALKSLGYALGGQHEAELLAVRDWRARNFNALIDYCRTAEAFQDIPFSCPYTFQTLDAYFPESKFILTVRDSPDDWYESLTSFHSKIWGSGCLPSSQQLEEAHYLYQGWPYDVLQMLYRAPYNKPYLKKHYVDYYENHNRAVRDYFHFRQDDLLVINIGEKGAYGKLCSFLSSEIKDIDFPHLNKT